MEIKSAATYNEALLAKFRRFDYSLRYGNPVNTMLLIAAVAGAAYSYYLRYILNVCPQDLTTLFVFLLACFGIESLLYYLAPRISKAPYPGAEGDSHTYVFGAVGFICDDGEEIDYVSLRKIYETKDAFYIYRTGFPPVIVDKAGADAASGGAEELSALLASTLPSKRFKKKS